MDHNKDYYPANVQCTSTQNLDRKILLLEFLCSADPLRSVNVIFCSTPNLIVFFNSTFVFVDGFLRYYNKPRRMSFHPC